MKSRILIAALVLAQLAASSAHALRLSDVKDFLTADTPLPNDCQDLLRVTPVREVNYPRHSRHFRHLKRIAELRIHHPERTKLEDHVPIPAQMRTGLVLSERNKTDEQPNCLNAILLWFGITEKVEQVSSNRFLSELNTRFKLVDPTSDLEQEDVIVLLGREPRPFFGREVFHAAVLFGREPNDLVIWHKPSRFASDPWTFERITEMFKFYKGRQDVTLRAYRKDS